jgi:hypothetical protein
MTTSEKRLFTCPLCGHPRADITARPDGGGYYISCWSCEADGLASGDWLRSVAEAVGAPGGGVLLADPERWLAPYLNGVSRRGRPAELPSLAMITGWHEALMSNRQALDRLRNRYGLRRVTLSHYTVGYAEQGAPGMYREYPAFTLPVFNSLGELVNVRKRFWPQQPRDEHGKRIKYVGMAGRGAQLYPDVPADSALLVAGEFDALVGRWLLVNAVSTTCGAKLPERLAAELVQSAPRVAVMYDVGEDQAAERAVEVLLAAGASAAWVVHLPLKRKGADLSTWHSAGRKRPALLQLIEHSRSQR